MARKQRHDLFFTSSMVSPENIAACLVVDLMSLVCRSCDTLLTHVGVKRLCKGAWLGDVEEGDIPNITPLEFSNIGFKLLEAELEDRPASCFRFVRNRQPARKLKQTRSPEIIKSGGPTCSPNKPS